MLGQELVVSTGGVEETAVIARNAQAGVALVDAPEEGEQGVILAGGVGGVADRLATVDLGRKVLRHAG